MCLDITFWGTISRHFWQVSSLEAYDSTFDIGDLQGIASEVPYESSKRLTDIMAITSTLPSTSPSVDQYLGHVEESEKTSKPRIYVSHPGICGTSIIPLPLILEYLMFAAFFLARWLGSQWHPVTAEKGAVSMVWLALAKQSTLDSMEKKEGVGKWGSATDFWGQERVERAEVAGWGWGGKLGEHKRKGRDPYAQDLTKKSAEKFQETGRKCWEEMEKLRIEWEYRLRVAGAGVDMD
jgi:3-keto steroid reductase